MRKNHAQKFTEPQTLGSPQQVSFTTQLMQNYRLAKPFYSGAQIATAPNSSDQTEVFSIGTDGHIYNVYPDPNSDTGWSMVDLHLPVQAQYVAAGGNQDGTITVYAAGADQNLYYNTGGQKWSSGWQTIAAGFTIGGLKVGYDGKNNHFLIVFNSDHNAFDICMGGIPELQNIEMYNPPNIYDWCAALVPLSGIDTPTTNPGIYGIMDGIAPVGDLGILGIAYDPNHYETYGPDIIGPYSTVTTANNKAGYSDIFALLPQDHGVYYIYLSDPSNSALSTQKISADVAVIALAAGSDLQGLLEVFALSTDDYLYHVRQDPASQTGWGNFFQLRQDLKFTQLVVGKNPLGYSDVFAVTTDNDLYHIWQDPITGDWNFEEVELTTRGSIEEFESYNVEVTAYDSLQSIVPDTQVKIFSDDPVLLEVNGKTCFLDTSRPWKGTTNAAGQVTIGMKISSLGFPPLKVWTSFMPANDRICVDASAPIKDTLSSLDDQGQKLLDAQVKDSQGNQTPLLQGDDNRDANTVGEVAKAVKAAMSLAATAPQDNTTAGMSYLHSRTDRRVARYVAAHDGTRSDQIHLPSVKEQHWHVDFSSGKPSFRTLTQQEAAELIAQSQSLPQTASFFGFDVDWGDVFDAVDDGIASVFDFTISKVAGVITAAITLIIKGVKYAFTATITLVQQAFDLAEEVFRKVQADFKKLFGWLGMIFQWTDILRTHEALVHSINEVLEFMQGSAQGLKGIIDNNIGNVSSNIQGAFQDIINNIAGNQTIGQYQQANNKSDPEAESQASTNIALSGFLNNVNGLAVAGSPSLFARLEPETLQSLNGLVQQLSDYASGLQSTTAFTNGISYFQQISRNPDQILQLALSGLLSIAEGVVLTILEGVQVVLDALLDLVTQIIGAAKSLLNSRWDIPFITDLYETYLVPGSPLSALDLFSLIVAIPATAFYKIKHNNESPFPRVQPDPLETFKSNFTSANLLAAIGLGESNDQPSVTTTVATEGTVDTWTEFFAVVYSANYLVYGVLEAVIDAKPDDEVSLPFTVGTFLTGLALQVTSIPSLTILQKGVSCVEAEGSVNFLWVFESFGCFMDLLFIVTSEKLPRFNGNVGVITEFGYGMTHLGVVALSIGLGGLTGAAIAENVIGVIPECAKLLRLQEVIVASEGASLFVLCAIDIVMYETACYIHLFTI